MLPLLQVIREIFRQEQNEDKTKVRLLYANRSEADTALRVAFDDLHYNLPDRFEVTYLFENKVIHTFLLHSTIINYMCMCVCVCEILLMPLIPQTD